MTGNPVAIVGSGIAGLTAALALASLKVVLITRAAIGKETSSAWAQGGIAAALGRDDSHAQHLADTLSAGDGHCAPEAASRILQGTAEAIAFLENHGIRFDRDNEGELVFGLEAAHSRRRILHAAGDGSGAAIIAALAEAVRKTPSITILSETEARRILLTDDQVSGLLCVRNGRTFSLQTSRVILATGGIGGLYEASTNPSGNFGQGIMLAARAGAELCDMEFVQFHPTALATNRRPLPLISEAVRGEGAILVNDRAERFVKDIKGAELAPRDVVARAIAAQIMTGRRVYLDARKALGSRFASRFPTISDICKSAGIDPARNLIPVRPAEHYHMGGIATDTAGRTSLPGLWAVGECAATGLHGANRLASNSLLEGAVMGLAAARYIKSRPEPLARPMPEITKTPPPPKPDAIRSIAERHLNILRDGPSLKAAINALLPFAEADATAADPAIIALAIAVFAHERRESRGAHMRTDFPLKTARSAQSRMDLSTILETARTISASHPIARSA